MNQQEKDQIFMLLQNIEDNKKTIPTFSDLQHHPIFGATFSQMNLQQEQAVKEIINDYLEKRIFSLNKTKG